MKKKTTLKKKATPKLYKLEMFFNDLKFKKNTNDLEEAILALKPEALHTDLYVSVSKGKDVMDRRLNLRQGRNLFINEGFRQVFLSNLLLQ